MRDLYHSLNMQLLSANTVVNTESEVVASQPLDLMGASSAMIVVMTNQNGDAADALNEDNRFDLRLMHADDMDGDFEEVSGSELIHNTASKIDGLFDSIDEAELVNGLYRVGYRGTKRYIKVTAEPVGAVEHGVVISTFGVKGHLSYAS